MTTGWIAFGLMAAVFVLGMAFFGRSIALSHNLKVHLLSAVDQRNDAQDSLDSLRARNKAEVGKHESHVTRLQSQCEVYERRAQAVREALRGNPTDFDRR